MMMAAVVVVVMSHGNHFLVVVVLGLWLGSEAHLDCFDGWAFKDVYYYGRGWLMRCPWLI